MSEGFLSVYLLYMLLGLFANIFLQFRECVLYTRASYTQVYMVLEELHVTKRLPLD